MNAILIKRDPSFNLRGNKLTYKDYHVKGSSWEYVTRFLMIIKCQHYKYHTRTGLLFLFFNLTSCLTSFRPILDSVRVWYVSRAFLVLLYTTESLSHLSSSLMSEKFLHWSVNFNQFSSSIPLLSKSKHLEVSHYGSWLLAEAEIIACAVPLGFFFSFD